MSKLDVESENAPVQVGCLGQAIIVALFLAMLIFASP